MNEHNGLQLLLKEKTSIISKLVAKGLICKLDRTEDRELVSGNQLLQLQELSEVAVKGGSRNPSPISLFPSEDELFLGKSTMVCTSLVDETNGKPQNILAQLLPYWISQTECDSDVKVSDTWERIMLESLEVFSGNQRLLDRIHGALDRTSLSNIRSSQFARSASYMGSKATLAPFLAEVMHSLLPEDTVVLDLMCGSGAAAGVFSRNWRTIASDAQQFSCLLAIVQSGGMTNDRAEGIANEVLGAAREHFDKMPSFIKNNIEIERNFLSAELTDSTIESLAGWIRQYPRIGNALESSSSFSNDIKIRQSDSFKQPYLLFSAYYGNLFFGVRQAAEIDSLRFAVEQLKDPIERDWALGALICAVSSCAYSYAGHFAQPKMDGSAEGRIELLASEILDRRGLSVSHEFFVRLQNLGKESAKIQFPVETIKGPWEAAFLEADEKIAAGSSVCVYFDPPYTRDEYSRYYHILETLVRYDYPHVQGKPSIPKRGESGRFASSFATRNINQIESLLVKVVNACLERGWSCLWSYSSTGVADIEQVLNQISGLAGKVEIFGMDHAYKAQGRRTSKTVKEYAFFISPKSS